MSFSGAMPTGYGLGKAGWVTIPVVGLGDDDAEVLHDFVEESYRTIAPKKLIKELDAQNEADTNAADSDGAG
jgi:predicted DNA-binding protein (MmcQ/YjbR family)